jgi:hypothetical protein
VSPLTVARGWDSVKYPEGPCQYPACNSYKNATRSAGLDATCKGCCSLFALEVLVAIVRRFLLTG